MPNCVQYWMWGRGACKQKCTNASKTPMRYMEYDPLDVFLKGPCTGRTKVDIWCIWTYWSLNDNWNFHLNPFCTPKIAPKFGFLVLLVSEMASPPNKFVTQMVAPPNKRVTQMASPPLKDLLSWWWHHLIDLFGGATIWVTNLFGGDAIWETSSTRKPNFGTLFRVQNGFKWKFQLSFSDQ